MYDQINEAMFEWALQVQSLVKAGWELSMEYGEQRLNIGPTLKLKKGDRIVSVGSVDEEKIRDLTCEHPVEDKIIYSDKSYCGRCHRPWSECEQNP